MASDLISRKAMNEMLDELCVMDFIYDKLNELPTVDAVEVVHGEWIGNGIPESVLSECSVCGYSCGSSSFNYCPNCGADMRGEKE